MNKSYSALGLALNRRSVSVLNHTFLINPEEHAFEILLLRVAVYPELIFKTLKMKEDYTVEPPGIMTNK